MTSFLSLAVAAYTVFFFDRIGEEKEEEPDARFMLSVAPVAFLNTLSNVILITALFIFSRYLGVLAIMVIVSLNFIWHRYFKYGSVLARELEKAKESYKHLPIKYHCKEIVEKLHLSALTSWIIDTAIVKSTVKVQLASGIISTLTYTLFHLSCITYLGLKERSSPEDFSTIVCLPRNLNTSEEMTVLDDKFSRWITQTRNTSTFAVRVCQEEESPYDFLLTMIVPVLLLSLVLKVTTGLVLSKLSNYQTLLELHYKEALLYFDAMSNPSRMNEDLLHFLHNNIGFINKQNRLTGETILHKLQPEILAQISKAGMDMEPYDEFLKLYIKGGQTDILDYNSRTAHSYWIGYHLPQLPRFERSTENKGMKDVSVKNLAYRSLLGVPLSGIDKSGNSTLKSIANQLLKQRKSSISNEEISFFKYLSREDVCELMVNIVQLDNGKTKEGILRNVIQQTATSHGEMLFKRLFDDRLATLNSETPMHVAIKLGDVMLLENLLELYPSTDARNLMGETPLHLACKEGNQKCAKLLIDYKTDLNARDNSGQTPLHLACQNGFTGCVKQLLSNNEVDLDAREGDRRTPLHLACYNGHGECVEQLLKYENVNPNARDKDLWTPLHMACQNGHAECIKWLLVDEKVDPDSRTEKRSTPLHVACQNGYAKCVKQLLLNEKVNPNARNDYGWTPLHLACQNGHTECLKLLVSSERTNPNAETKKKFTPLHLACQNGHSDCVEFLLLNDRVNPNPEEMDNWTPLHMACQNGNVECVKLLLSSDQVNPNTMNSDGFTPLHLACQNGHWECVRNLMSNMCVDPNPINEQNATPLHLATQNGHLECVQELLMNPKVDPNITTEKNFTSLHLACQNGHADVVRMLLEFNADPNKTNDFQMKPSDVAVKKSHHDCEKILPSGDDASVEIS